MTREARLWVNDSSIPVDYFVEGFIDHTIGGMAQSLEGVGEIKALLLEIEGDAVTLTVNGSNIPVNKFVSTIFGSTVRGMVSVLKGVDDLLPRIKELTIQGLNDTNSPGDRAAIAEELRQINDELLALANTKDSNGEYIFAGYDADAVPFANPADGVFAYSGDAGSRTLQISATRQVQDRENGFDVFMDIDTSTGGKRNLFETVHGIIAGMEADNPDDTYLDDLNLVQEHIADFRTRGGSRLNSIDEQKGINGDFILTLQTALSNTEDLDLAEAVSRFEQELVALQAAQQTFNMVQGLSLFNYL